ncbi:MAG TPA: hypothetical protein VIM02_06135 [Rhizomicrobium sp.]|jgi:hypothetical protein
MKNIDIQTKIECAAAGVAVLKALRCADKTMTYGQFAEAIGLLAGDVGWKAWHRRQVSDILYLLSAAEGRTKVLDFARVHDQKGQHGKGLGRESKLVRV